MAGIVISSVASKVCRIGTGSIAGVGVALAMVAMAEPPRLVVRPPGTNQLELVASSLQNGPITWF
jgi:hypothetical protein